MINYYINQVNETKKENDIPTWTYFFFRLLEYIARTKRSKKKIDWITLEKINEKYNMARVYQEEILEMYRVIVDFEFHLNILNVSKEVESKLLDLIKERDYDLEERILNILVHREFLDLVHSEMKVVFPREDFGDIEVALEFIDEAFDNLYLPKEMVVTLDNYIKENNVDVKEMKYFNRESINYIPIILPYVIDEVEAEVFYEKIKK